MRLAIHTVDGGRDVYEATDAAIRDSILQSIQPHRFFEPGVIEIEHDHGIRLYPKDNVVRADFAGPDLPAWSMFGEENKVEEIPRDDFLSKYRPFWDPAMTRGEQAAAAGEKYRGFVCLHLPAGARVFLRIDGTLGLGLYEKQLSQKALAASGFCFRNLDGGNSIVNRVHMRRIDLLPGRPGIFQQAWRLTPVE